MQTTATMTPSEGIYLIVFRRLDRAGSLNQSSSCYYMWRLPTLAVVEEDESIAFPVLYGNDAQKNSLTMGCSEAAERFTMTCHPRQPSVTRRMVISPPLLRTQILCAALYQLRLFLFSLFIYIYTCIMNITYIHYIRCVIFLFLVVTEPLPIMLM